MLAVFTKAINLVTAADITELRAQTWPEGYQVEFKETLPHKTGGVDPWLRGQASIGDYARDEILAEVIAFANSQGGSVIVGIAETPDNPPRAAKVVALPRVGDLARRFEDQARSCIDPPLPRLQIRPIETDGHGKGVLVFRTSPSRAAPHRLTTTRDSYVRRGTSTVRMTMREIQDMTLNVARGLAGIDATFRERRNAFREWAGNQKQNAAYRVTALPLVDLPDPGRLYGKPGLFPPSGRKFKAAVGGRPVDLPLRVAMAGVIERPLLRGVVQSGSYPSGSSRWSIYQSGLSDLWISVPPTMYHDQITLTLHHSEILGAAASSLSLIDDYRSQIGASDAEYGIEIEICRFDTIITRPLIYCDLIELSGIERSEIWQLDVLIPPFPVGSRSEFSNLLATIDVDIWDALGIDRALSDPLQVNI
jgi:hypothetical protein